MRLIDVDYLLKELEDWQADLDDAISGRQLGVTDAMVIAYQIPTVEAEPVRHGKWIFGSTLGHSWMKCSECCVSQDGQTLCFSYCPNCGARMDEE